MANNKTYSIPADYSPMSEKLRLSGLNQFGVQVQTEEISRISIGDTEITVISSPFVGSGEIWVGSTCLMIDRDED